MMFANATSLPKPDNLLIDKPILKGWGSHSELKLQICEELSTIPSELQADISEIIPSPTASYPDRIVLYTRSAFEVITTIGYLSQKLVYLEEIIEKLKGEGEQSGRLLMLEADVHVPYDRENE